MTGVQTCALPISTAEVVATILVEGVPWAVAVNPQTNRIYVAQRQNNTVSVIDRGGVQQASSGATIGIDVDIDDNDDGVADNTATSLGTVDRCISVSDGAVFDVDIFATDVIGLEVWNVAFHYDPSVVNVIGRDVQMFLAAGAASQVNDQSFGDPGLGGVYDLLASDVSEEAGAHESGSGVLARLTLKAVGPGVTTVAVEDPFLFPFQSVESTASALIAVDEACPG